MEPNFINSQRSFNLYMDSRCNKWHSIFTNGDSILYGYRNISNRLHQYSRANNNSKSYPNNNSKCHWHDKLFYSYNNIKFEFSRS